MYGRHAAIHIRSDLSANDRPTLALEGAFRQGPQGSQKYQWDEKLYVQLTLSELPVVACTFLGWLESCTFAQRGRSGKGFEIQAQEGHLFLRLWQGTGKQYQVRTGPGEQFHVAGLALRQCGLLYQLDGAATLTALKASMRNPG